MRTDLLVRKFEPTELVELEETEKFSRSKAQEEKTLRHVAWLFDRSMRDHESFAVGVSVFAEDIFENHENFPHNFPGITQAAIDFLKRYQKSTSLASEVAETQVAINLLTAQETISPEGGDEKV